MATGGLALSKEFFELLKAIGESKSKQEEDRIVSKEVARLKAKMEGGPGKTSAANAPTDLLLSSKKRAKEFLVRLLYVEMLGHDASFGYIKAIEMAASASLYHKRTGYLVCSCCLSPHHEFRFMLVNQMQRDLQSANVLEVCGGVIACSNLITSDMVPAVSSEIARLLSHDSATVRKKAIICLYQLHRLAPEVVTNEELYEHLRKVLCDKDPAVMGSSLNVINTMARTDPRPFKDLVPSLVSILKQINDHRLPQDYDYHRISAPWMQILLIRILGLVGKGDAAASSQMYEILKMTMANADTGINAGYAITYECVRTIVTVYPNPQLMDTAADAISRFIQSRSHNLKYLGVTGLAMIVEGHPQYAAQHQLAVMDCLEDPDETLQRKTLDLLYRMTNPVNVEFIAERLIEFLSGTTDLFLKRVLTSRVCTIAERYAPNNAWYIRTVTKLFEVSGDMVTAEVAQNLMSLIAEGTGESEEADMLLRQNAVEIYVALLKDKPLASLPKILLETMAWCLGEYGYLSAVSSLDEILMHICSLARTHKAKLPPTTRKFLLSAIMKLIAQAGTCPPQAAAVIDDYTKSCDVDLQQRCLEFQNLLTNCPNLLPEILPVDASAEDVQVDVNLSFLDGFVSQALSNGARPYSKPEDLDDDDDDAYGGMSNGTTTAFKMTPYEKPQAPAHAMLAMSGLGSAGGRPVSSMAGVSLPPGSNANTQLHGPAQGGMQSSVPAAPGGLSLNTRNVANVWGKGGITSPEPAPPPAAPPAPAAPAATSSTSSWGASPSPGASNPYGSPSARSAPAPPPEPVKTAEQLEKERKAAALFGGIVPGAPPPPPPSSYSSAPAPAPRPPVVHAPPVSAPAPPPPAPAPEVDLLDLGAWDSTPAPAPAAVADDAFSATSAPAASASAAVVETVSEDDGDVTSTYVQPPAAAASPPAPAPAPPPAPPQEDDDPFASAGLLGDMQEKPLATFAPAMNSQKFEYNGSPMAPLPITTQQFGQQWGPCTATASVSIVSTKAATLTQFMDICSSIGCHKVESISATNEGICAGMFGAGTKIILLHGKVTPLGGGQAKIDVTVKSTDQSLCGPLAMYLQTVLR